MFETLIIIFSRPPIRGKVKTRLADDLGPDKALLVHQQLFEKTLGVVKESGFQYKLYLSARPHPGFKHHYSLQEGSDLGIRMARALRKELKHYHNVVLIGSDCLDLTSNDFTKAFGLLEENDLVLGPAEDGGYYLIGMSQFKSDIFENITWGTDKVLQETQNIAKHQGIKTALLATRKDVDTVEDLPENWNDL